MQIPSDTAVRHSFVAVAAPEPLSPREARARARPDAALDDGAGSTDVKSTSPLSSKSKTPVSPRRHTVSPYDGATLAELERQVHFKRKQSFRRKLRGKKVIQTC
jgi:hypothetical protein